MIEPMCYHSMETVGDRLYALGGSSLNRRQLFGEVYDIESDQWTALNINMNIRECVSSCVRKDEIFFLSMEIGGSKKLYRYSTQTNEFKLVIRDALPCVGYEWYRVVIYAPCPDF